jgi:hypothetical protein
MFHLQGVDTEKLVYTLEKRPMKILDGGRVIEELL